MQLQAGQKKTSFKFVTNGSELKGRWARNKYRPAKWSSFQRVPVSVVGYDDVPISSWPAYDLTTVRQPANRMVAETVSILIESIENKTTTARRIEIDGPLMVRGSARMSEK